MWQHTWNWSFIKKCSPFTSGSITTHQGNLSQHLSPLEDLSYLIQHSSPEPHPHFHIHSQLCIQKLRPTQCVHISTLYMVTIWVNLYTGINWQNTHQHNLNWGLFHEQFLHRKIHIRWKFHSAPIQVVVKWSLWNFAHGMTAVLSWHVHNFVEIWYPAME